MTLLTADINACAEVVQKGDPDRFLAVMSIKPDQRAPLFVLYAFNLEIARAAWASQEPMVGQMRLQFWRDVLETAADDGPVRAHEVARPLTMLIRENGLDTEALDQMITARWWDLNKEGFDTPQAFPAHIEATAGNLMWLSAQALGAGEADRPLVQTWGFAQGLAAWFQAVPELEKRGCRPLFDGRSDAISELARAALSDLKNTKPPRASWTMALRTAWQAEPLLKLAAKEPQRVADGALALSEFHKKRRLFFKALTGRP
ncbi:squalene/phytoene synthase family protein [Thalassobius sp. I31.1]|uniref:squalene/phytoene synthase family protein n=1 Tax=Thalassobius sp. I31.1 TaxID=2109912 RepID=UPI001E5AC9C1|nr:squalene/phytoene synthase family protein [Thalassobius sp. I31.1]